jgi:hypothetical protein
MISYFPVVTGSLTVSGSVNISGGITASGGISISGSIASASFASTASFVALAQSASNAVSAQTASFANTLTVAGTLTAQTLVVQTITSSVIYSSGSNVFGNNVANTQTFTGSILASGSAFFGGNVLIGSTSPAGTEKFGVTRDDGVTDGLHIIADFNRSGSLSAELILGYYASGSAVTGPVVYAANSQPLLFGAGSAERMRLTATGNLGLGVTPSAWGSSFKAFEILGGSIFSTSTQNIIFLQNAYNDGSGFKYTTTDNATQHRMQNGDHIWYNAPSGTAGAAITFAERMRITSVGQIGINTSSPVTTNLTGSLTIYKSYNADQASVPSTTAQSYYLKQHGLYIFGRNSGIGIIAAHSEAASITFANPSTTGYATIGTATGTNSVGGDMYFNVGSDTERMRITAGGEVVIGTTTSFNNEKLRVAGTITSTTPAIAITSAVETLSVSSGTTTTVWTCPDYPRVMYFMVFTRVNSGANVDYSAYAVIASSNISGAKFLTNVGSAYLNLSISGRDIRVTQTSGATIGIHTSVIQIFSNAGTI